MKKFIMRYSVAIPLLCVFVFTITDGLQQGWSNWLSMLLDNAFFYGLGCQMLGFAIGHLFFGDAIAEHIGWEKGSPFQFEVGMAALAIAVLGLLAPYYGNEFQLATVIIATIYLWGCAGGHIRHMVKHKNFAPGNAGYVFWWDILYPLFLIVLLVLRHLAKSLPIMVFIFCLSVGLPATCLAQTGGKDMELKLEVLPKRVLIGDPIHIRVSGLQPGQTGSIVVSGADQFGNIWSSQASFKADGAGTIDTSRDAPVEGSYQGKDQAGLFWSMTCQQAREMVSPFPIMPSITITLIANGQEKVSQVIERVSRVELDSQELTEPIVGVFFRPRELSRPTPALIVLGGSEGGYNQGWAAVIASKTRLPTLALAYFGFEGLPATLENIPLETIEKALQWLNQQPFVAKDCFGIIGASRGGELAILSASIFHQIKAVVGYTPSGVIWQGIGSKPAPAWTFRGHPFPYLLFLTDDESQRLFLEAKAKGTTYFTEPSFLYSLKMQESRIQSATIPVENSKAAFLLIGNPNDGVWPSQILSKITIDRLKAHNHPRSFEILSYDQGGHMLVPYPYYPTTMRKFYLPTIQVWEGLGGTAESAAKAASDSWPKVIEFILRELRCD
ncbi:MAG: acyl-CoA thioesterase/bile acid-CoA:amino acid N-acyltransferase family protein [Thermodesulforhabdaceae bacterium]